MQKIGRASAQVAGRFLFLGVSVQILLGICWGVRSFGIFPEFGDSYTWLKASETLVCDDYMGIGYPLFLMLVKGIESISSIPYTFFVYTVQILIAFYAGVVFLRACGVTGKKIFLCWGSLALLTFPCAMQSHLAVLPNSPGYSFLLLELSAVSGSCGRMLWRRMVRRQRRPDRYMVCSKPESGGRSVHCVWWRICIWGWYRLLFCG